MALPVDVVTEVTLGSAREIFDYIDPNEERWANAAWVFRGVKDASWGLVPSVLREENWKRYINAPLRPSAEIPQVRALYRCLGEVNAFHEFMVAADRAGLAVPEDSQALRSMRTLSKLIWAAGSSEAGLLKIPIWPPMNSCRSSGWPSTMASIRGSSIGHGSREWPPTLRQSRSPTSRAPVEPSQSGP